MRTARTQKRRTAFEPPRAHTRGHRVLVVDDEDVILQVLQTHLERHGCEVRTAEAAESAVRLIEEWEPEVAIVDIILPGKSGLELAAEMRRLHPDTEVMVMTGSASADTALRAVREGAAEYLLKPLVLDKVWSGVQRAAKKRSLVRRNRLLMQEQERCSRELSSSVTLMDGAADSSVEDLLAGVLDDFVSILTRELDVERTSVMLVDEATGEMKIVASHGLTDVDTKQVRVRPREGISGFVAETGEPMLVKDADADGRLGSANYPNLAESFLSVPIALELPVPSRRQILGVVNVTNRRSGEPLDERDLTYLRLLTTQLAATLDGARRSQKLQHAYRSLKATQDQLIFSERIQAVGQLAAGVAHDINNALSVILARAEFMTAQFESPEPDLKRVRSDLETIVKTCLQGAETVRRIQNYTRTRQDAEPSVVELDSVVRDAVELARPKWQGDVASGVRQIEVIAELGETPPVRGNVHELTQVVNNLIFNAVEAMPTGGRLTLRTLAIGDRVRLEVSDTGVGMDESIRSRLFQPFFTTKENGQGLGTSIIYGIVTRHEGEIEVESAVGVGTNFLIKLPRIEVADEDVETRQASRVRSCNSARILLVDDDDGVRETYAEALRFGGHDVVSCDSARSALARCEENEIDLIITDLSMGEMSGLELAGHAKEIDATLPVILFSGWNLEHFEMAEEIADIDFTLVKPCRIEDLLEAVQQYARFGDDC